MLEDSTWAGTRSAKGLHVVFVTAVAYVYLHQLYCCLIWNGGSDGPFMHTHKT
jgi:hypothetical protein